MLLRFVWLWSPPEVAGLEVGAAVEVEVDDEVRVDVEVGIRDDERDEVFDDEAQTVDFDNEEFRRLVRFNARIRFRCLTDKTIVEVDVE